MANPHKTELSRLTQLTGNPQAAIDVINENSALIEEAIDDAVSRSGKIPNQMTAAFDMNSNRIINLGEPEEDYDAVRYKDVSDLLDTTKAVQVEMEGLAATTTLKAQEASESASSAAASAVTASDVLTNPAFITVSEDLLLGANGSIGKVNANKTNIDTVAGISEDVTATAAVAADIPTVADIASDISTNAGIASDITTNATNAAAISTNAEYISDISATAAISSDISTAAGIASDISTNAGIASDITTNATNATAISTNATNISDISTAAGIASDISTNATNATAISTNAEHISDISTAAGIASDISTNATNATAISTNATYISDISTVAGIASDVSTNATNATAITTNATNITDIQNASANAAAAAASAVQASTYAVGDPAEPTTGHSAKWYSEHMGLVFKGTYNASTTYDNNDFVSDGDANSPSFYISIVDNNVGNPLTDTTKWSYLWTVASSTVAFSNITGQPTDNTALATALSAKLDKTTSTGSYNRLYGVLADGTQTVYNMTKGTAVANAVVQRNEDGEIITATPTTNSSATTKSYVDTALSGKQNTLVSGTSIKTINSTSLLGSGDISLQTPLVSGTSIKTVNSNSLLGSGDVAVQATLVSGTNIKTVNSNSLLGSGDIAVQETLVSGTNIKTVNNTSLLGSGNITISGGADTDLSNVTATGKNTSIGWFMPDYTAGSSVSITTSGYVTSYDCWVVATYSVSVGSGPVGIELRVDGYTVDRSGDLGGYDKEWAGASARGFVPKGSTVKIYVGNSAKAGTATVYPLKGAS